MGHTRLFTVGHVEGGHVIFGQCVCVLGGNVGHGELDGVVHFGVGHVHGVCVGNVSGVLYFVGTNGFVVVGMSGSGGVASVVDVVEVVVIAANS